MKLGSTLTDRKYESTPTAMQIKLRTDQRITPMFTGKTRLVIN
mgnify:CR=1 FL=1